MRGKVRRTVNLLVAKFRKPSLKEKVLEGDLDAISSALAGHRLPYAYAIWKNPKFKNKPELQLYQSEQVG